MSTEEQIAAIDAKLRALLTLTSALLLAAQRRGLGNDIVREAFEHADLVAMKAHGTNADRSKSAGMVLEELEGLRSLLIKDKY